MSHLRKLRMIKLLRFYMILIKVFAMIMLTWWWVGKLYKKTLIQMKVLDDASKIILKKRVAIRPVNYTLLLYKLSRPEGPELVTNKLV
jgi:hypothetical protein